MRKSSSFVKNNFFVFSSRIAAKIITFILLLFLARNLSPEKFGLLSLVIVLANIFSTFQDLGTSFILVREIASKSVDSFKTFLSVILIKTLSGLITFGGLLVTLTILGYSKELGIASIFWGLGSFSESMIQSLLKFFEGKEEMNRSSLIVIAERILIVGFILLFFNYFDLVLSYSLGYLLANLLIFCPIILIILIRNKSIIILNINDLKNILKLSVPFIAFNLFSIIYYKSDLFIIAFFKDEFQVGIYRSSYQIIESFYFIAMSLSISLLPLFSKYFSYNKKQLKIKFSVIFREFLILSAFLTVVLLPKSGFILSILYPQEYLNGEKVFQVLSVTIPLYFANIILGNLLIAIKKEKIQILSMIIGATVKLLILFFFIPIFGIVGAAITCLISDLLMLVIQYIAVKTAGYIHIIGKTDLVKISIIIMSLTINFLIQNIWIMILILPVFFIFIIDTFRTIKLKI